MTAQLRLLTCLNVKNFENCIYSRVWKLVYTVFVHIPSSFYIVYNLVEIIGSKYTSKKRITVEIVVISIIFCLYAQDVFVIHYVFSMVLWMICVIFYIATSANVAYCIYTKNVDKTDRDTQNVISSMRSLQIICFIIIIVSIYDAFINSFNYYSCIQALQYSTPAVYSMIDAFVFNQLGSNISDYFII